MPSLIAPRESRIDLRQSRLFVSTLSYGGGACLWALTLLPYGNAYQQCQVEMTIALTALTCVVEGVEGVETQAQLHAIVNPWLPFHSGVPHLAAGGGEECAGPDPGERDEQLSPYRSKTWFAAA